MIVTFITEDGKEKESVATDGVILYAAGGRLHLVDAGGDVASISFSPEHPVLIEDEGGDNIDESEDTGFSSRSYSLPGV